MVSPELMPSRQLCNACPFIFPCLRSLVATGLPRPRGGGMVSLRAYRRAANRRPAPESTWPSQLPQAETPAGKPVDAPLSCSRGGERPIQYGLPGVFIPGETRSSSGALSSPGGPGWPPGPLSNSSRRIFDHARVLFGTGLGRPRRCLPPRSRIGPRRRRQQRGEGAARRPRTCSSWGQPGSRNVPRAPRSFESTPQSNKL